MENCTLLYGAFSSADSGKVRIQNSAQGIRNPANYWNPESKLHWQGIRNPRSSDMDSGIPYHDRNPDFRQLGIQLKVPYIGGEKKWHSLIVESSPRFWCCIWHWFNLDFSSKRGDTSCFLWGPYCFSVLCPDLPLTYGEKCCRRSGYEINLPLSKAASARKTESTRAVHALSKYVGTCGQKRERGL